MDVRLRTVAVPEVLEEARRNGVQTKNNRNKSSTCDNYVTCVDVTDVVSNKLFWNSNGVVRFVSQKV